MSVIMTQDYYSPNSSFVENQSVTISDNYQPQSFNIDNYINKSEINQVQNVQLPIQTDICTQIINTCKKNKNLIKVLAILFVLLMHPLLIFFPIFYYLIRYFTQDTKYILILVTVFSLLITNGVLGTIYIALVIVILTMIWNYDNINYIMDLFTPTIENKVQNLKKFIEININKAIKISYIGNTTRKLERGLNYLNSEGNSKISRLVGTIEICCDKILQLCDFVLDRIVNHIVIIIISALENLVATSVNKYTNEPVRDNIYVHNSTDQNNSTTINENNYNKTDINTVTYDKAALLEKWREAKRQKEMSQLTNFVEQEYRQATDLRNLISPSFPGGSQTTNITSDYPELHD